jgi:phosphate transport system protein
MSKKGGTVLRQPFDQQQRLLQDNVLVLGSRVEEVLRDSIEMLKIPDKTQAKRLLRETRQLYRHQAKIVTDTLTLVSTQQPMARDLRFLAAVFQIALELGRIANNAREISKISLKLEEQSYPEPFVNIVHMASSVTQMFRNAMAAFAERDPTLAQAISIQDNEIDDLYVYINQRLLAVSRSDADAASHTIYLLQIAHQLERVGDRSTNICEWVIYAVTGYMVEMNVELNLENHDKIDSPTT